MTERWRRCIDPIASRGLDVSGYEVSDRGRVRNMETGRVLKGRKVARYGHLQVTLYAKGVNAQCYIHGLVMASFVGVRPEGMECRHLDGNPANNRIENLAYGTRAENHGDRKNYGRHGKRLTEAEAREIRQRFEEGENRHDIARDAKVHVRTVQRIGNGHRWAHLAL